MPAAFLITYFIMFKRRCFEALVTDIGSESGHAVDALVDGAAEPERPQPSHSC